MMNANTMRAELAQAVVTVTFTKDNGETRVMRCSLNQRIAPVEAKPRALRDDLVIAWDVDADGWRTFKVASVTGWEAPRTLY
jgi:hypothetical protein